MVDKFNHEIHMSIFNNRSLLSIKSLIIITYMRLGLVETAYIINPHEFTESYTEAYRKKFGL